VCLSRVGIKHSILQLIIIQTISPQYVVAKLSQKEKMDRLNDGMDYAGDTGVGSFFSTDFKRFVLFSY